MKLCKDCAWYEPSPNTTSYSNLDQCSNPDWVKVDLVRGEHHKGYCEHNRMRTGFCGLDAVGFTYNPGEPVDEGGVDGAF